MEAFSKKPYLKELIFYRLFLQSLARRHLPSVFLPSKIQRKKMDLILKGILISNKEIYDQWIFTVYKRKNRLLCAVQIRDFFKGLKLELAQAQRHCS